MLLKITFYPRIILKLGKRADIVKVIKGSKYLAVGKAYLIGPDGHDDRNQCTGVPFLETLIFTFVGENVSRSGDVWALKNMRYPLVPSQDRKPIRVMDYEC